MSDALPLDGDRFQRIRNLYWVPAHRDEHDTPHPWTWVFSPNVQPRQMPNRSMYWRRPTYAEAVERQRWFDEEPDRMAMLVSEYATPGCRRNWGVRTGLDDLPAVGVPA